MVRRPDRVVSSHGTPRLAIFDEPSVIRVVSFKSWVALLPPLHVDFRPQFDCLTQVFLISLPVCGAPSRPCRHSRRRVSPASVALSAAPSSMMTRVSLRPAICLSCRPFSQVHVEPCLAFGLDGTEADCPASSVAFGSGVLFRSCTFYKPASR